MTLSGSDVALKDCLNCGAELRGAFCSRCGQRDVPPNPSLRELLGDAWHELTGYDGRLARTFTLLLRRPGALTRELVEGRRARYVSPFRVYLVASLLYFLIAAAAPNLRRPPAAELPGGTVKIDLADPDAVLDAKEREEALAKLQRAPWFIRALLIPVITDPAGFRSRFRANLPRMLFVLVPAFAAIVGVFYRKRRFPQHLIFALHLHAVIFFALAFGELADFTRSIPIAIAATIVSAAFIIWYALVASRHVYQEPWRRVVAKSMGVAVLYSVVALPAFIITFAITAFSNRGPA